RKINNAENQLAFIHLLRYVADGEISPEEAVRAYHGVLQKLNVKPHRSVKEDMTLQTNVMSYCGNGTVISFPAKSPAKAADKAPADHGRCACTATNAPTGRDVSCNCPQPPTAASVDANGTPDFSKMTAAEKIAYHKARWDRILG